MSILCIGQVAYDITLPIEEKIVENQKYRIYNKLECLGGPAGNASYLCAIWNAKTTLLSRVGEDTYGNSILHDLEAVGVQTQYIQKPEGFNTPLSVVLNHQYNGARTIFNMPGDVQKINFLYPSDVDVLLFDGHELEASLEALEKFPQAVSILDAGTLRESTETLARKVDYLICSESFAKAYVKGEWDIHNEEHNTVNMQKMKTLNSKQVVVTFGEHGLLYEKENKIVRMPAFPVKALDTTGAGDIFHGAFAYAMDTQMQLEEALRLASMTSAISVTKLGGQTSIPTLEEVMLTLDEKKSV